MKLIVGLGNPGPQYESTRHNLGFMLVDALAREAARDIKRAECRALVGHAQIEGFRVELVKPQTFMNLSGESVACLARKRELDVSGELLVISDDLAIPFGTLRLRERGSSGGHNGLGSIIDAIRTDEFVRLRIGIRPEHPVGNTRNFVLERFNQSECIELERILERGMQAVRIVLREGVSKAMALFN